MFEKYVQIAYNKRLGGVDGCRRLELSESLVRSRPLQAAERRVRAGGVREELAGDEGRAKRFSGMAVRGMVSGGRSHVDFLVGF